MENKDFSTISFFSMIADPIRHDILKFLLNKTESTVSEIIQKIKKPQTLVSYHLRCLKDCELINKSKSDKDARQSIYSLHDRDFIVELFSLAQDYLEKHNICQNHEACQIKDKKLRFD
ncbi:MAG: ArsR/SmtB family transcription factor [Candidatus Hodarchaeales archaeon]